MPSVGLVLGAGGVVGGAYHAGTLAALAEVADWDARTADVIVGTSAGSIAAAALRAGLPPSDHLARVTGSPLSPAGRRLASRFRSDAAFPPRPRLPFSPRPAAPQLVATAFLRPPWQPRPVTALAGLLPEGSVPTEPLGDRIRDLFDTSWPDEPLWVCALRLRDGARVVFGRDSVAAPDVGTAVEASSAIPGYMAPVRIGDDRYVDGGAHSPTNADLLAGLGLDLVVVVSAMSADWSALRPSPNVGSRVLAGWALEREVRAVRAGGTPVLVIQPTGADVRVMGPNSMDPGRRVEVATQANASARRRLEHPSAADLVSILG
jgi:NTE family protein